MEYQKQANELVSKTALFCSGNGVPLVQEFEKQISLLLAWLDYLDRNFKTKTADNLIDACSSCLRESASYLALGLIRPVIFSLRTVIDLCLAWLYFKDHNIEWERVNETGDGFKMKKDIFDYLTNHINGFGSRHGILKLCASREVEDIYRLLSAHIHGQSEPVLFDVENLSDVVFGLETANEINRMAFFVAEYLSDVLVAKYAHAWYSFPSIVQENISARLDNKGQRTKFFEGV